MLSIKALDDILNDPPFWLFVEQLLARRMAKMNARAIVMGLEAAAASGAVFDLDALYARALAIVRANTSTWSRQMADTTREALRQALATWQAMGNTMPEDQRRDIAALMESLDPMFGEARADRVAATETTRHFNDGGALAMLADDAIMGERWETALDERVCAICGPQHGLIYPKGQGPACPVHINCRCGKRPVNYRYIQAHPRQWQGRPVSFEVRLGD